MVMPVDPVIGPGIMDEVKQFRYKGAIEHAVLVFFRILIQGGHMVCYHNAFIGALIFKSLFQKTNRFVMQLVKLPGSKFLALILYGREIRNTSLNIQRVLHIYLLHNVLQIKRVFL